MHHMPLLVAPLASSFFFSGFGVAQIVTAPNCSTGWNWVCMSFLQRILLHLPDLMAFASRHSILSTKVLALSQRTSWQHAMGVVSHFSLVLSRTGELYRLISFAAYSLLTLLPRYSYYRGPDGTTSDLFTSCLCSTTLYSLLSACSGCQGETWIPYILLLFSSQSPVLMLLSSWSEYASNCTQTKSVFS